MSDEKVDVMQHDDWLNDDSDVAALVLREWLKPVDGKDAVIFPPTYPIDEDKAGYNIDRFEDGWSVCQIDSVGSQANRLEPIFKRGRYRKLVPHVVIKAGKREVDLLEAGHRAADAIVRFSDLAGSLEDAFKAVQAGDATKLAKISPTSLVFGVWDSRGTQVKLPRIVRSVIRAYKVRPLRRSAQYIPPLDYVGEGLVEAPRSKQEQESMSQLGLRHAPAPLTHGGIVVEEEIRRDAALNLVALRALNSGPDDGPLTLRRYVLGLCLVVLTAPQEMFLREGCQLTLDQEKPPVWRLVRHSGAEEPLEMSHERALAFAEAAAEAFGVGADRTATFNSGSARAEVGRTKEQRKESRRGRGSQAEQEG